MFFISEIILVVGSNTRPLSKSLKELGYTVYATSFYDSQDQRNYVDKLLIPKSLEDYDNAILENLALDYVNEVDYIICCSGVRPWIFPHSKIIGNYNTEKLSNKYYLYKKFHKNFLVPKTYKLNSFEEAEEIVSNNPDKKYITKPIRGCGGMNIYWFNMNNEHNYSSDFLLQEYITGSRVSSSFVSYSKYDSDIITFSNQIIGSKKLGSNSFMYCGNITPSTVNSSKLTNISLKIGRMFNIIGSNGVDFIFHENNVYVIELNPRIQGTMECIEHSFGINMAKVHIDSSNNKKITLPKASKFSVKLIPYSTKTTSYDLKNLKYIHDIPLKNTVIKKSEPICTILTDDRILENAMNKAEIITHNIYNANINLKKE